MITEILYTLILWGYIVVTFINFTLILRYKRWIVYLQIFLGYFKFIFLGLLALHVIFWCNEEMSWRSLKGLAVILMTIGEVENLKLVKNKLKHVRKS